MSSSMPGKKCYLPASKGPKDKCVGRFAKRGCNIDFAGIRKTGHRVEPASANDSDLSLLQTTLRRREPQEPPRRGELFRKSWNIQVYS